MEELACIERLCLRSRFALISLELCMVYVYMAEVE